MKNRSLSTIWSWIFVVGALLPSLGIAARCSDQSLTEVRSLATLPAALRQLLPAQAQAPDGIADRGAPFNGTDVVDAKLPRQRFVLAAVGSSCAIIAVEHGGIAHNFVMTEFRLASSEWHRVSGEYVFREPASVDDLMNLSGRAQ
jgi:hypothetical protein